MSKHILHFVYIYMCVYSVLHISDQCLIWNELYVKGKIINRYSEPQAHDAQDSYTIKTRGTGLEGGP